MPSRGEYSREECIYMKNRKTASFSAIAFVTAIGMWGGGGQSEGPRRFSSPDEARRVLVNAMRARDRQALQEIFGPEVEDLLTGDSVEDGHAVDLFARGLAAASRIEKRDESTVLLHLGKVDWTFPIPIERKEGGWYFNTHAGKHVLIERRVRQNEQSAIQFARQYVLAQMKYAAGGDMDGDGVGEFAQAFLSTSGKRDGLYWQVSPGEDYSPLSPIIAFAKSQGYNLPEAGRGPSPFRGYFYRILTRQGADAPGGAQDYLVNGNLVRGFALVAYPARHGSSGRRTFIVNQAGNVYQKDLGPETGQVAAGMTEYNPDSSWTPAKE